MNNRCNRYYNCPNNACENKIATVNCNPGDKKYWKYPALEKNVNPVYYNVMNGCWLCNFLVQETENQMLCNRSFFNGVVRPPCNLLSFHSKNSNDYLGLTKANK
jgi:hypothetical protein